MSEEDLARQVEELRKAIEDLNNQKFMRMHSSWGRFAWTNVIRGIFVGFGSVIGATLFLYFFIQFLSNIDFIPIIGNWAIELVDIINRGSPVNLR